MGISKFNIILDAESIKSNKTAPDSNEKGRVFLLSEPIKNRIQCGIIKPIKPIIPDTDTQTAVIKETQINNIILNLFELIPIIFASLSPKHIILISLE